MKKQKLLLGNEAIARGLLENGCRIATSYPGTPASEILAAAAFFKNQHRLPVHVQWAVNEKIAFEIAYAGAVSGLRCAVSMKQVGLNVASDPLMSATYMGTKGGFIVISADDPGPHSSQTEQDSRLMAMLAKIPVLDPDSPADAKELTKLAFELSETFEIPVMLRPTTRICHARQNIAQGPFPESSREPEFEKNPARWAATPKFRFQLHNLLEEKLHKIALFSDSAPVFVNHSDRVKNSSRVIIASGVASAHTREILEELGLFDSIPMYRVLQPYPLHSDFVDRILSTYEKILILEETTGVIEMQFADRRRVMGKMSGHVPRTGELLPELIEDLIRKFANLESRTVEKPAFPGKRPTLCAGCMHRAAFYAVKRAAPKGIYTGDIGCYTLGLNLNAVDTVLCMGASISQAAGFYHAFKNAEKRPSIIATIGDSTFFHSGIPALLDAVVQRVEFVLLILDNGTTAMTGNQPTPASGFGAYGEPLPHVDIESLVKGCGAGFCKTADPYDLKPFISLLKEAVQFCKSGGPAVVIAKARCLLDKTPGPAPFTPVTVEITDECDGCQYCTTHFECPALIQAGENRRTMIDTVLCSGCGVCVDVCPKGAIIEKSADSG